MTTNTLLPVDLSTTPSPPKTRPVPKIVEPPPAEHEARGGLRSLIGGCLLNLPRIAWLVLDAALVCAGTVIGDTLFVWWDDAPNLLADYNLWLANVILASSVILAGNVFGLYEPNTLWARSRIVARGLLTVTLAMLATWLVMHLFMYSSLSRRAAASGIIFYLFTASAVRLLAHHALRDVKRGLLVIGQGPLTGAIIRSVRRGSVPGYRLVGLVVTDIQAAHQQGVSDIPIVGEVANIEKLCRKHGVAEVVVADAAARNPRYQRAALACLRLGCRVTDETTFYETTYGEVPVSHITPHWFLTADLKGQRQEHAIRTRLFDLVVATAALILAAPLLLAVAIAIKLEGRGPALYSQTRVGKGGRRFTLYKFRTMHGNAETPKRQNAEAAETAETAEAAGDKDDDKDVLAFRRFGVSAGTGGARWAAPNDPRVTRIGRFLRRSRLDELPQIWNILKGDMSVVGPRPERPEFVGPLSALIPFYDERHLIKPGLTGWAQINYAYGATVADARRKLQLDLYYIKHTNLELDLIILLRTLGTFFRGAR